MDIIQWGIVGFFSLLLGASFTSTIYESYRHNEVKYNRHICYEMDVPEQYVDYMSEYSFEFNIPIKYAIMIVKRENAKWDTNAYVFEKKNNTYSHGLFNLNDVLLPDLKRWLKIDNPINPYDPVQNIMYSLQYLQMLKREFKSWDKILCAWNAGKEKAKLDKSLWPERTIEYIDFVMKGVNK
jgi:hypothetical protein